MRQQLVGNVLLREIDLRQQPAQGDHAGLAAEGFEVRADEAVGDGRQPGRLDVRRQRHAAAVDLQNLLAAVLIGNGDRDFAVEPARPAQGRIQHVGQVGGRQHDDVLALRESVHQAEQLRHDAFFHVADRPIAVRGDGVDLVQEDDARRPLGRLVENLPQVGLALAVELMDDFRPVDGEEIGLGFVGHGPGDQRLAAAGRPEQQHALRRFDAQPLEQFRISQRQLDDFADPVQLAAQPADVLVGDGRRGGGRTRRVPGVAFAGAADLQQRVGGDHHRSLRGRALHEEIGVAIAEQRGPDAVAGHDRQTVQEAADVFEIAVAGHVAQGIEDHFGGRRGDDAADDRRFADGGAGVLADDAVDLDASLAAMLLEGGQQFADGRLMAHHFHDVADVGAELAHVGRVDACQPSADVFAGRFADFQGEFLGGGGGVGHAAWVSRGQSVGVRGWGRG